MNNTRQPSAAWILVGSLALVGATACLAAEPTEVAAVSPSFNQTQEKPSPDIADGQATHQWLSVQSSGKKASKQHPSLPGPVLRKINERYVNSFGQAIPEQLPTVSSGK